jgi:hypothetical protein
MVKQLRVLVSPSNELIDPSNALVDNLFKKTLGPGPRKVANAGDNYANFRDVYNYQEHSTDAKRMTLHLPQYNNENNVAYIRCDLDENPDLDKHYAEDHPAKPKRQHRIVVFETQTDDHQRPTAIMGVHTPSQSVLFMNKDKPPKPDPNECKKVCAKDDYMEALKRYDKDKKRGLTKTLSNLMRPGGSRRERATRRRGLSRRPQQHRLRQRCRHHRRNCRHPSKMTYRRRRRRRPHTYALSRRPYARSLDT